VLSIKMEYKILFLGTGGGRYVVGDQTRGSGGIILKLEDTQFHLDPGPGSLVIANKMGIDVRKNDVVLVSHSHLDHCNDVNAIIDAMTFTGLDKQGIVIGSKSVIYGSEKDPPYLTRFYRRCVNKCVALSPGKEIDVNGIRIKATKTKHTDETGIGFKFFTNKFVLSYVGDTNYINELVTEHKGSDILLINNQRGFASTRSGPFSSRDSVKLISEVKPHLAILTHFGKNILEADPMYEARDVQKLTGVQTVAAKDGMVIDLLTYSSSIRQKTLQNY